MRGLLAGTRLIDLEILCGNYDIDVLCLTETWLSTSSVPTGSCLVNIPGFQAPIRCDRSDRRGGGVAIYVKNGISATTVKFHDKLESACIKISSSKRKHAYIVTIYRPPKVNPTDFITHLQSGIDNLTTSASSSICILGDFNAKHSSWWNGQNTDEAGKTLFDFASVNGLTQLVAGATRCPHLSSAAQLDLIFVNDISRVNSCQVLPQLSDHCPTLLSFACAQQHQQHCAFNRSFYGLRKDRFEWPK